MEVTQKPFSPWLSSVSFAMDSTLTRYLSIEALAHKIIPFGWKLAVALVVLLIGLVVIRIGLSLLKKILDRSVHDSTVRSYIYNTVKVVLWVIMVVTLLNIVGVQTTSFVAVVGAAGLAIGLALQGSLSNFAAGVMLLLFRPFHGDDEIEVAGVTGRVVEIDIFSTVLDLPDGTRAFVPNGVVFTGVIRNRTVLGFHRPEFKVKLAADADVTHAREIIVRVLEANPMVQPVPRSEVQIADVDATGVTLVVRAATDIGHAEDVRAVLINEVRTALAETDTKDNPPP